MIDWNIQSRAHACQSCQQKFADKQHYFTLLFQEKHELKRSDVCEPCWKEKFDPNAAPGVNVISRWQGVYEAPPAAPPEAIQKDTAETLLRKLIELNDPTHAGACFILAVMLERKRLLKEKQQIRQDGKRIIIYEHPKSGDMFTIADPDLQLNQLEEVQRDVGNLLEHGLPGSEPAPAEVAQPVPGEDPTPTEVVAGEMPDPEEPVAEGAVALEQAEEASEPHPAPADEPAKPN